jgi:hypothetical protein
MGIRNLYLDHYEFAGIVANSRVFRREKNRYIHFITLGVGEGEYVDLVLDGPIKYTQDSVISGHGTVKNKDCSQFLQCSRSKISSMPLIPYLDKRSSTCFA